MEAGFGWALALVTIRDIVEKERSHLNAYDIRILDFFLNLPRFGLEHLELGASDILRVSFSI